MVRLSTWLFLIGAAFHACQNAAAVDPCFSTAESYTVEDTAGAGILAEAVNCSGGTFNVEWHGAVVVDVSIAVGQGSTLSIMGMDADASVDGNGTTQLFVVGEASLTLSSLQLANGFDELGDAAINAVSSILVLQNTTFRGNKGGAMSVSDSVVSFSGETTIMDNDGSSGAGVYVTGEDSVVSWSGVSTFFNNTCTGYGCAVYAGGGGRVSWSGETTFESNSASDTGSAVSVQDGANASWSGRTTFVSNTDRSHTGCLFAVGPSTLTFVGDTSFINNTGAVQLMGVSTCVWKGKTSFINNKPKADHHMGGGALYSLASNVSWSGEMYFTNNTVVSSGGALNIVTSNVSWSGKTNFSYNTAEDTGGAIYIGASTVELGGETVFSHNSALGEGGAMHFSGGNDDVDSDSLVFAGITKFDDNHSGSNGAIALGGNSMISLLDGAEQAVTFTRNSATYAGGALYLSAVTEDLAWTAVIFHENSAAVGGAVYSTTTGWYKEPKTKSPVRYDGCLFRDNVATATGGAVESVAGYDEFWNTSFINNTARSGGGVRLAGTAELIDCEFNNNGAYDEAPAVRNIGYIPNISYVSFAGNLLLCDTGTFLDIVEDDDHYDIICDGCPECFKKCDVENVGGLTCTAQYEHSKSDGIGVTLETLEIEQGYWRATNTSRGNGILACYNEDACEGGVTGSAGYCAQGYTGPYCSTCTSGFAETLAYTCQRCMDDWKQQTLAIFVGAFVAVAGVGFVFYMASKVSTEPVVQRGRLLTMFHGLMRRLPLQGLKVIIVTWQILTQFDDVANARYPSSYGAFLDRIAAAVSFDLGWVLSAGCFAAVDFHDRLLAATIGPIALLCLIGGTYFVATRRNSRSPQAIGAVRRKHASAVLLLAFLVYSSVSATVFRMFACESLDDGFTYLRADYAILCDSTKHKSLQLYAAFMIAVYPVGIPLLYAVILFRNRDILKDGDRRICDTSPECQSTGDLWKPYKPSRFYYELVECARRVSLTGIIVFTFPNTAAQVATTIVLAFMFIIVFESADPYMSESDVWLARVGNTVVFLSLFLALLAKVDVSDEREYSAEMFGAVLIAVNILMVLAVIAEAVYTLRTSFSSEGDSVREDPFAAKASTKDGRGITHGSPLRHRSSEDACEQKEFEQETPPAYTRCTSKAKHKIGPKEIESTCIRERGAPPAYKSMRNMITLQPSQSPRTPI